MKRKPDFNYFRYILCQKIISKLNTFSFTRNLVSIVTMLNDFKISFRDAE